MEFIFGALIGAVTAILGYVTLDDHIKEKERSLAMFLNETVVIANRINDFVENWTEGESYFLTIPIEDLFLEDDKDLENKIDEILINTEVVESFEIKCNELILEINMFLLQDAFDERMAEWTKEKEINQEDYYGRRAI